MIVTWKTRYFLAFKSSILMFCFILEPSLTCFLELDALFPCWSKAQPARIPSPKNRGEKRHQFYHLLPKSWVMTDKKISRKLDMLFMLLILFFQFEFGFTIRYSCRNCTECLGNVNITITSSVTAIGPSAFKDCSFLKSVFITS